MRASLVLLLLAATLLPGCADSDDPPATTTPAPPTPEPTPPTEPTPTPPTVEPTTPTEPTPVEPTPPPPRKTVYNQTFDFSTEGDPTGQSPKTRESDAVPAGYATVSVFVNLSRLSGGGQTIPVSGSLNAPTVRVLDPTGALVFTTDKEGEQTSEPAPAIPGKYTIRYEGAGTVKALVSITAIP